MVAILDSLHHFSIQFITNISAAMEIVRVVYMNLPLYHIIIDNMHVCSFMCTISHVHGRAPKTVLRARNLVYEKL